MDRSLLRLIRAAIGGEIGVMKRLLADNPQLAIAQSAVGATRASATGFFFADAGHYLYAGDTALHMAAAAFQRGAAEILVGSGAIVSARNRRGAAPLHYAADANRWAPTAQRATIEYLLAAGANPNALDSSGVAPLHRAVRTRSSAAVEALLIGGADVQMRNGRGTTPLGLALRNTGRGGSGSPRAKREQARIIEVLIEAAAEQ
jgi:ankyrin repeat protein